MRSGEADRTYAPAGEASLPKAGDPRPRESALEREVLEQRALLAGLTQQLAEETQRLAEARRQVGHAEKLRLLGQFVGGVVHDVNNVLAVMHAAAQLVKRRLPDGSDGILQETEKALERGQALVRQLLDFARLDGASADVVSPLEAIRADAGLLARLAGSGVEVIIEGDENVRNVVVESARLQSVLFNLVANARDACDGGGRIAIGVRNVRAAERPTGLPRRDYVRITVADTGCGMTAEALARAGEPFFTTKAPGKGTGLGLASAFELADRCRGRILLDSAPGAGTRIHIYLPVASALGEPVAEHGSGVDPARHGGATLLVVENEPMVLDHLVGVLRGLGYAVIAAANHDAALARALGDMGIDLVIADLHLGSGSGVHLADRLRRERPQLPFIFLTGSSGMGVPHGEVVFRKPFSEAVLARAVLERLGRLPASALTIDAMRRTDRIATRIRDPRVRALFEAWRTRARELGRLPNLEDARAIRRLCGDNSYVVEVIGDEDAPLFRFLEVGSALIEKLGRPLVGETLAAGDEDALGAIVSAYKRCLGGIPYFDFARFRLGGGRALLFERLLTPLSDDGERVSHLLGAATFDETFEPEGGTGNANGI